MKAINVYVKEFGYNPCEDNTRAITIKAKDQYKEKVSFLNNCSYFFIVIKKLI